MPMNLQEVRAAVRSERPPLQGIHQGARRPGRNRRRQERFRQEQPEGTCQEYTQRPVPPGRSQKEAQTGISGSIHIETADSGAACYTSDCGYPCFTSDKGKDADKTTTAPTVTTAPVEPAPTLPPNQRQSRRQSRPQRLTGLRAAASMSAASPPPAAGFWYSWATAPRWCT